MSFDEKVFNKLSTGHLDGETFGESVHEDTLCIFGAAGTDFNCVVMTVELVGDSVGMRDAGHCGVPFGLGWLMVQIISNGAASCNKNFLTSYQQASTLQSGYHAL